MSEDALYEVPERIPTTGPGCECVGDKRDYKSRTVRCCVCGFEYCSSSPPCVCAWVRVCACPCLSLCACLSLCPCLCLSFFSPQYLKPRPDFNLTGVPLVNGRSQAPVYYSLAKGGPHNLTAVFTFWFFHSNNGCGNIHLLMKQSSSAEYSLEYQACPVGVVRTFLARMHVRDGCSSSRGSAVCAVSQHEGDWENVQVEVCADMVVSRVGYSQHGFRVVRYCSMGDCLFARDDGIVLPPGQGGFTPGQSHPVAYSALESHALYPEPDPNAIYAQIDGTLGFDGAARGTVPPPSSP